VAFQLGDGDIEIMGAPPAPPAAPGVRSLAQPMSFIEPEQLGESDLETPEIPGDEPTKVGAPNPAELERARQEGLAMLLAQQEQREQEEATRVAPPPRAPQPPPTAFGPPPVPAPPPQVMQGTAPGHGFGTLDLGAPFAAPPVAAPAPAYGNVTAQMPAIGTTTQKLPTSRPPPAPLPVPTFASVPAPAPYAPPPLAPVLVDVTPLTLAVETVEGFCDSIIGRNTTVPCSRTREFVTAADNQTSVRVRVSQGESKRFMENTLLGEIELSGLRPARRGDVRIAVSFALDASGMLVVSAKDVGTGRETSTQVRLVGLPDAAEVQRMQQRQAARGM
jgi:molecular chaperone DnaK